MGKIKNTKNELKAQRDALKRFKRYLPTLLLKKQQLQIEVRQLEFKIDAKKDEERQARKDLAVWVRLFSEPLDLSPWLSVSKIERTSGNIAGVNIPVLQQVVFRRETPDLYATPAWVDEGLKTLEQLVRLRIERRILDEQLRLLADELRTTSQRVNLFEKVKIPESAENIRVIRIFLGDMDTAGVARAKIAKGKSLDKGVAA
ncbi:MAG TPA: V-type ATP synthase subunit D [Verrucomicrobia bacterium]|nr:MAG: V-type ATP synthase subunit D [Lentisphaerae bacterium GWF2_57_35]HBA83464.1 V-type ATP synthase subunit D [Verrucomicrobiota bacterium]